MAITPDSEIIWVRSSEVLVRVKYVTDTGTMIESYSRSDDVSHCPAKVQAAVSSLSAPVEVDDPEFSRREYTRERQQVLWGIYNRTLLRLTGGKPQADIDTWADKRRAKDHHLEGRLTDDDRRLIDGVAAAKGVTFDEAVEIIRVKSEAYIGYVAKADVIRGEADRRLATVIADGQGMRDKAYRQLVNGIISDARKKFRAL